MSTPDTTASTGSKDGWIAAFVLGVGGAAVLLGLQRMAEAFVQIIVLLLRSW